MEIKKKRFAKIPCMLPSRQTHPYMQPLLKESGSMEKKKNMKKGVDSDVLME